MLAEKLVEYKGKRDVYVLSITAGVEAAYSVAERPCLPLDVVMTRKLHVPWNPEAGFGAVSWDGQVFINEPLVELPASPPTPVPLTIALCAAP